MKCVHITVTYERVCHNATSPHKPCPLYVNKPAPYLQFLKLAQKKILLKRIKSALTQCRMHLLFTVYMFNKVKWFSRVIYIIILYQH